MREPLTVFVPNGDSRQATAVLLTGTAREYDIDQREVKAVNGGFFISDRLADIVYEGGTEGEALDTSDVEPLEGEADALPPYEDWEYGDLKSEVATRELDVPNQKAETLVAALVADDEAQADAEDDAE